MSTGFHASMSNAPPGASRGDEDDDLAFPRRPAPKPASAPELLEAGARTYRQRNELYGDNYKHFGSIMAAMFPDGLPADMGSADWNRLALLMNVVGKAQRYAMNLRRGGHRDSARDAMVYAAMLEELTDEHPF